jgi:beta-lactamase superfamily II metal-dependent hydrolase
MPYDIEFIPVDSGERSGDAIVVRWSDGQRLRIGVIDGGTKESGEAIVSHIRKYYGAAADVDFALNTHPDCDHCSGLTVVLEELPVRELLMHLPWNYSAELVALLNDERVTEGSLQKRLKDKLARACDVEKLARKLGIPVREPFQGTRVGPFVVLSPSLDWYKELVVQFRNMPEARNSFGAGLLKKALDVVQTVAETLDIETLRENGETSAENESSVILYGDFDGRKILLTGDAGIQALNRAADYADLTIPGWNRGLAMIQIPHHGSRRNVSPSILNRLLGPRVGDGEERGWAFASASKESKTHPRKAVLNAFKRRGYKCCATQGHTKRHYKDTPDREGWGPITPFPFFDTVETYD